ncbi:hypothetical protein ACIBG8_22345 [Nonomuraea sp. NPDC050556]|uniref:hypothetical protein n=1 Tax=Nonomuraea sp. NPDC050556 TaxID=3364369 RepID=UPI0037B73A79
MRCPPQVGDGVEVPSQYGGPPVGHPLQDLPHLPVPDGVQVRRHRLAPVERAAHVVQVVRDDVLAADLHTRGSR